MKVGHIFPCNADPLDKTMADNSNAVSHLVAMNAAYPKQYPSTLNL